jgi:Trk K+ transport system NAD-binding subunit
MSLLARLLPDSLFADTPRDAEDPADSQGWVKDTWRWLKRKLAKYRWYLLAAAGIVAFILGCFGWWQYFTHPSPPTQPSRPRLTDIAYWSLKNFLMNSPAQARLPWPQDIARFLAPAVAGYAGLAALGTLFRDRMQQMRIPLTHRHVVVCGLGDVGYTLVRHLRQIGERVVVVEADATNPHLDVCRRLRVPIVIGDAQSRRTLAAAGVDQAARLVAVCLDDVVNTEIVFAALELTHRRRNELRCLARIADPELCALLRTQEAKPDDTASALDFFNIDEISARGLLNEYGYDTATHALPNNETSEQPPHILVAQLDVLGQWLVWHAARDWYTRRAAGVTAPLVVTVVDDEAKKRVDALTGRYPALKQKDVCRFIYCSESFADIHGLKQRHSEENEPAISRAYVTAYHDQKAMHTALKLRHTLDRGVPLVAAMWRGRGLARLTDNADGLLKNIDIYSTLENSCTVELIRGGSYETIAQAIHQRYLKIQEANQGEAGKQWEELPEPFRESSREQARHIAVKLREIGCEIAPLRDWGAASSGFTEKEVESLAEKEHERWAAGKEADGWRWGEERDDDNRRNPWLRPYDELPESQKQVDRDFVRAIPSLLASVGLQIIRAGTDDAAPSPQLVGSELRD